MKAKEAQGHFKNSNLTCLPFTFEVSLPLSLPLSFFAHLLASLSQILAHSPSLTLDIS